MNEYPDSSSYQEAQYGLAVLEEQGQLQAALSLLQQLQEKLSEPEACAGTVSSR
ncbi:MAG: hypothetical protein R2864_14350 [Syntrophotaleaceae bacterium]